MEINEATIKEYIREQEDADMMVDKVSVKGTETPLVVVRVLEAAVESNELLDAAVNNTL